MSSQRPEQWINGVLFGLLVACPLLASALDEAFYISLTTQIVVLAMAGVGLNLALGVGGMVSFGHAAFFGLGGYVAGIFAYHAFESSLLFSWPFAVAGSDQLLLIWPVALLVSAVVALFIGALSLRTAGVYFIMITLAFAQMIYYLAVSVPTYGGEDGLSIYLRNQLPLVDTGNPLVFCFICIALLFLVLHIFWRINGSRFGVALQASHSNSVRLATVGIAPFRVQLTAFVISAMMTGLAGALYADLNGFVGPSMLSWQRSGEIMVIVILGGVGRLAGPLVGAVVLVLLETFWVSGRHTGKSSSALHCWVLCCTPEVG